MVLQVLLLPIWLIAILISSLWRLSFSERYGTCNDRFYGRQLSPHRALCQHQDTCFLLISVIWCFYVLPLALKLTNLDVKLHDRIRVFFSRWRCYRQTTFHSDLQAMERIAEGVYDEELSDEFELTRAGKDVREAAEELVRKFLRHDLEARCSSERFLKPRNSNKRVSFTTEEYTADYDSEIE